MFSIILVYLVWMRLTCGFQRNILVNTVINLHSYFDCNISTRIRSIPCIIMGRITNDSLVTDTSSVSTIEEYKEQNVILWDVAWWAFLWGRNDIRTLLSMAFLISFSIHQIYLVTELRETIISSIVSFFFVFISNNIILEWIDSSFCVCARTFALALSSSLNVILYSMTLF